MQGTITAEAGGTIGGASIGTDYLKYDPYWQISASSATSDPVSFISSSAFKVSADGRMTASAGKIASWVIDGDVIKSTNWGTLGAGGNQGILLEGDATPRMKIAKGDDDYVLLQFGGDSNWGIKGNNSGNSIFELGSTNQIAGWTFDNEKLTGNNIIISSSGDIQTADFQSAEFGTGRGYKLGADGIAEFEEAKIRGTLKTAVFEKDTVSAVGGQLIVSNATAVKSGSLILSNSFELRIIAGSIIIIFSLHIIGLINIKFLNYEITLP